jgi:two-component system cell cycle sensor histidine kinase/response regulator CckA
LKLVKVRLALGRDLPPASIEASQVEQVLINLLFNAQEAIRGGGTVTLASGTGTIEQAMEKCRSSGWACALAVEEELTARTSPAVFVEVRDNGPGIPPGLMPQIFQAFFTSKAENGGTGLGLSISRTIVKNWGGNILVASSPGRGASFRMFLPINSADG